MSSLVKCLTLGFSSGHDHEAGESELRVGLWAGNAEPGWDSVFPSLSAPPSFALSVSLSKINK